MFARHVWLTGFLAVGAAMLTGCQRLKTLQDPLSGQPVDLDANSKYYQPSVDAAAAQDMSVADVHFAPHTAALNDLGRRRLDLLCITLEEYGGTVRYETRSVDKDQVAARMESVRQYLSEAGMDSSNVQVAAMLSGGRGSWAGEAFLAKKSFSADKNTAGTPQETKAKSSTQ